MIRALNSAALPAPRFRYSQMVQAGPHIYCSGLLGLDDRDALVAGGPGAETRQVLSMLPALLDDLGLDWDNLVFVRLYCTDFSRFSEVNAAWEEVFTPDIRPPARSAIGVSALPLGASVEIELVFYSDSGAASPK